MRYVFLDIDGPLNTGRNDFLDPDRYGHHFDDVAVRNLRWIVEETGARIVVSSSWRHMGVERIREIWKAWGLPGDIAGCTPGAWGSGRVFSCRGEEIWQWLAENADTDDAYVIIDDMGDLEAIEEQKGRWLTVNAHTDALNLPQSCPQKAVRVNLVRPGALHPLGKQDRAVLRRIPEPLSHAIP